MKHIMRTVAICIILVAVNVPAQPRGFDAIRNLDYTILLCDDLPVMKTFYTEVMGFEIHRDLPDWIELRIGSSLLTLRPRGLAYDGGVMPKGTAAVQLAFRVPPKDVDHAHETLLTRTVPVVEAPKDQAWGHRTLFFHDPEGNVIEIYADI
jgi:catechol 2,3-dioxygenase-like lactoylglutathione lyase family enzyme